MKNGGKEDHDGNYSIKRGSQQTLYFVAKTRLGERNLRIVSLFENRMQKGQNQR
jgi:hypothetical protein